MFQRLTAPLLLAVVALGIPLSGCDHEAEGFEHDGEYFQRVQQPADAAKTFSGGYEWTGTRVGETEFFNLNGPNGQMCLAVPAGAFPDPAPAPGQLCTATGCKPDPQFPGCFTCDKLT